MKPGPWMTLAMAVTVPILMQTGGARTLLIVSAYRWRIWLFLGTMALLGVLALLGYLPIPVRTGPAILVAVPAIQAITFVLAYKLFGLVARRSPVPLKIAQISVGGMRYIADALFWVVLSFGLTIGAAFVCAHFDVELPLLRR